MNIMQPYNIRVVFAGPLQKFPGRGPACKAMAIRQACIYAMQPNIPIAADTNSIFLKLLRYISIPPKGDLHLVSVLLVSLGDRCADFSGGAGSANCIY